MLHIVLLILKIIGVTLAILLGVLLLMICLALFVPVRYRIQADGKLGEDEPLRVRIKVTWLFHILNALMTYSKAVRVRVRIFFFTLFDSSRPKKEKKEKIEKKPKAKKEKQKVQAEQAEPQAVTEELPPGPSAEKKMPEEAAGNNTIENDSVIKDTVFEDKDKTDASIGDNVESGEESGLLKKLRAFYFKVIAFFRKLIDFFQKFLEIIRNIEYTIAAMCDKIKKIIENIGYYTELLQGEVFKEAFGISKKQLFRIIRNVRPRKCDVHLTVGTGDPASTGQILAIYGMLYPFIGNNVIVQADFENMILEGSLDIRGRVTAFTLLIAAFRLYRDKNIRQLLNLLKREDS